MNQYTTKSKIKPNAGHIQAQVNLKMIAQHILKESMPGGICLVFFIPDFDPDNSEYQIFDRYYWNPVTGDRGGAIKFIQKVKNCSYQQAVGYIDGWLDRSQYEGETL